MPAKLLAALFVTVFLACFLGVAGGMIVANRYEQSRIERERARIQREIDTALIPGPVFRQVPRMGQP
jgi:hypothetical protein